MKTTTGNPKKPNFHRNDFQKHGSDPYLRKPGTGKVFEKQVMIRERKRSAKTN